MNIFEYQEKTGRVKVLMNGDYIADLIWREFDDSLNDRGWRSKSTKTGRRVINKNLDWYYGEDEDIKQVKIRFEKVINEYEEGT